MLQYCYNTAAAAVANDDDDDDANVGHFVTSGNQQTVQNHRKQSKADKQQETVLPHIAMRPTMCSSYKHN